MDEGNDLGDWKKLAILGSGAFGVVSLWRHKTTNDCVAIKKCRWNQPSNIPKKQRERWTQEVEFMKRVQHANIVSYKKLPDDFLAKLQPFNLSLLPLLPMEYCSGGNLRRLLSQPENACGLREQDIRGVLNDLSAAVSHLHQLQITHRDIKPENVVLQCSADRKVYKLIDLGYAKDMDLLNSFVGTLGYTAPEIFLNKDYNYNVDYWSFGIVVYEICCGKHPFLPKLPPMERFKLIAKKAPRDICVYQSQSNKIIYTDKIHEPNHVSLCFRTHLEDWLGTMLEYESEERGKTRNGDNVFVVLKHLLQKHILHVFSVYNYTHYHYEIDSRTTLVDLQLLIQKDTGLLVDDQLIITANSGHSASSHLTTAEFYKRIHEKPNSYLVSEFGVSSLNVFRRNEFVRLDKVVLPLAVRKLIQRGEQQWDQLCMQTSQAVHYVEHETDNMKALKCAVNEFYEYLKMVLLGQHEDVMPAMHLAAQRLLQLIEFCKELNAVCQYTVDKQDAIKNYRKHLWRVRELIENVNSATVRYMKMKTRARLLKVSFDKMFKWMEDIDIDKIYCDALNCMNINKQQAVITAKEISIVICACIKTRKEVQQNGIITQHIELCFKVLREYDKLTRWMKALTGQLKQASTDLLEAQKSLSKTDLRSDCQEVPVRAQHIDLEYAEHANMPTVDDLIKDNRILRYNMQEVLSRLLLAHKYHATSVKEFVAFVDDLQQIKLNNDVNL